MHLTAGGTIEVDTVIHDVDIIVGTEPFGSILRTRQSVACSSMQRLSTKPRPAYSFSIGNCGHRRVRHVRSGHRRSVRHLALHFADGFERGDALFGDGLELRAEVCRVLGDQLGAVPHPAYLDIEALLGGEMRATAKCRASPRASGTIGGAGRGSAARPPRRECWWRSLPHSLPGARKARRAGSAAVSDPAAIQDHVAYCTSLLRWSARSGDVPVLGFALLVWLMARLGGGSGISNRNDPCLSLQVCPRSSPALCHLRTVSSDTPSRSATCKAVNSPRWRSQGGCVL